MEKEDRDAEKKEDDPFVSSRPRRAGTERPKSLRKPRLGVPFSPDFAATGTQEVEPKAGIKEGKRRGERDREEGTARKTTEGGEEGR